MGARHTYAEAFCFTTGVTIIPAKKEYVKLWVSYKEYFEPLADDAIGRLVRAMIEYKTYGEPPELTGDERFVWPAIKRDVDESIKANEDFSRKQSENGKKGGRPKKQTVISESQDKPKNPSLFFESQKTYGLRTRDYGQGTKDNNIIAPTLDEVLAFARDNDCDEQNARNFYKYFNAGDWRDKHGALMIMNWKQKLIIWDANDKSKKAKEDRREKEKSEEDDYWANEMKIYRKQEELRATAKQRYEEEMERMRKLEQQEGMTADDLRQA